MLMDCIKYQCREIVRLACGNAMVEFQEPLSRGSVVNAQRLPAHFHRSRPRLRGFRFMELTSKSDFQGLSDKVLKLILTAVREETKRRRKIKHARGMRLNIALDNLPKTELFGLADPGKQYTQGWDSILTKLLDQDWTHLFKGDAEKKYYVYIHYEPGTREFKFAHPLCTINLKGVPFYVGKGTGNRAYDLKRNEGHGRILRSLVSAGYSPDSFVTIVGNGLDEASAFALESKLIYFFGTRFESQRKGVLVNLDIPPRPTLVEGGRAKRRDAKERLEKLEIARNEKAARREVEMQRIQAKAERLENL